MILIAAAVILTLTDKNQIQTNEVPDKTKKKLIFAGWGFAIAAGVMLVSGLIWGTNLFGMSLNNLGFNSIFMTVFMMAFLSIIMFTNASSSKQDAKAYNINLDLFETDGKFLLGAMGIIVIITALYAYFW